MSILTDKKFLLFLTKFIVGFCFLYYGTIALIGFSVPGNYYLPWVDKYFSYYSWLRNSLVISSRFLLSCFGYDSEFTLPNYLKIIGGKGATIGYDCLGYGVISFWVAFIFANQVNWKSKLAWIAGGSFLLWLINVFRITIILIAHSKDWKMPFGWNHHTWFNIVAYTAIFLLIGWFDHRNKIREDKTPAPKRE